MNFAYSPSARPVSSASASYTPPESSVATCCCLISPLHSRLLFVNILLSILFLLKHSSPHQLASAATMLADTLRQTTQQIYTIKTYFWNISLLGSSDLHQRQGYKKCNFSQELKHSYAENPTYCEISSF